MGDEQGGADVGLPYPPAPTTAEEAAAIDPGVFEAAARAGDAEAAYRLGCTCWQLGRPATADHWWQTAADRGHVAALYALGHSANERSLLPGKAARLLTRAAEAGSVDAMVELGRFYDDSSRQAHHRPDAVRWWTAAAQAGRADAMVRLGELSTDAAEAGRWYRAAVDAGSTDAMDHLATAASQHGDLVGAVGWWQRAADAADTGAAAKAWLFSDEAVALAGAADGGDHDADRRLGTVAADAGDLDLAHTLLQRAADAGDTAAMRRLAHLLEYDDGDAAGAGHLLTLAMKADDPEADCDMADFLLRNSDGHRDSAEWGYRQAAEAGIPRAMVKLGDHLGGRSDEATGWYQRAADAGDGDGWCCLGDVARSAGDDDEATRRWQRGADAGSGQAMARLAGAADERGDAAEAQDLWQRAAAAGNQEAAVHLAGRAEAAGDASAAERWKARARDLDPLPPDLLAREDRRHAAAAILGTGAMIAGIVMRAS